MVSKYFKDGHRPDFFLLAVITVLTVVGLVVLASASLELGKIRFNDNYYYLKHQIIYGLSIGIVGLIVGYFIQYKYYRIAALPLLIGNIALLILVFTSMGIAAGGATRWLQIGPISFQPAEFLKLTLILYLAAWFSQSGAPKTGRFTQLIPFLLVCGTVAGLLILQPATSTVAILLFAGFSIYFVSGAQWKHILAIILLGIVGLSILIYFTPYRRERVLTFLNPSRDVYGSGHQITQALLTIGSGGLTGVGYGQSNAKSGSLPAPIEDSIFAIAAQELGFIGAGTLATLFAMLVFRMMWLARRVRDRFGALILIGFATIIATQSLVNMGAISGLLPLTGVPLPFISYGGTALAVFLSMAGISLNISKYT